MSKTVAIVQARMSSTRLPGKVLYTIAGLSMISLIFKRLCLSKTIDSVILATGEGPANDALAVAAQDAGYLVYRGSEDDVLDRYAEAAHQENAEVIVRVTADCPLVDPAVIDRVVAYREAHDLDYCTNVYPPSWPDGLDVSVFTRKTLEAAHREATLRSEREHVVPWMWKQSPLEGGHRLSAANIACETDLSHHRWTVDETADYHFIKALATELGPHDIISSGYQEVLEAIERSPTLSAFNTKIPRDAGLAKSREEDLH